MPYDRSKLSLVRQSIAGPKQFRYDSTDDAAAVAAAGYFNDGADFDMEVNDVVEVMDTDGNAVSSHTVTAVDVDTRAASVSAAQ